MKLKQEVQEAQRETERLQQQQQLGESELLVETV